MKKVYFNTFPANPNPDFDFNKNHMVGSLEKYFETTSINDAEYHLILDLGMYVNQQIEQLVELRKQGQKIILMVFDPAAFGRVDNLVRCDALDKLILFDKQFEKRFPIKTFISDYFVNENIFPEMNDIKMFENEVCVYGTIGPVDRNNEYNLKRVDFNVNNYVDFFNNVKEYNGVCVYDTGMNEHFSGISHYNHCKPIEALMCGVNAYCQSGIKTKRYDRFLKKFEQIPNPVKVDFDREDIKKINKLTIEELIYECEYI